MIKNIVFDLGDVLLTGDDRWIYSEETHKLLNIYDKEKLFEGWSAAWPDARVGKITEEEFFSTFLKTNNLDVNEEVVSKLKQIYRKTTDKQLAYPALEKLKNRYELYSITNITKEWLEYKVKTFELDKYLKVIVSSCWQGIGKPHTEIYEALIEKANINPNESIFIDDLERNLPPAQDLGFNTIHFITYENMKNEMEKLGVRLD